MTTEQIKKIFLKPNIEPLDSNTQRIRRNLISTSVICLLITKGTATIDLTSSVIFGIKFTKIDLTQIYLYLLISLLYFLIHFTWATIDSFKENLMRLTGIDIPMITSQAGILSSGDELNPGTNDKRYTSIYSWYFIHYQRFKMIEDTFKEQTSTLTSNINQENVETIRRACENFNTSHSYIETALKRYEKGFWQYQLSQVLRWLLLDYIVPISLGCSAIYCLFPKVI